MVGVVLSSAENGETHRISGSEGFSGSWLAPGWGAVYALMLRHGSVCIVPFPPPFKLSQDAWNWPTS